MASSRVTIPSKLPLLLIDGVLFPTASIRIPVSSEKNMNMVKKHLLSKNTLSSAIIGVIPKESKKVGPEDNKLHTIGTAGIVIQVTGTNWPKPAYTLLVTGLCRFRLDKLVQETPYLIASICQLDRLPDEHSEFDSLPELSDLMEQFREQAEKLIDMLDLSMPAAMRLKRLLNSLPAQCLPDVCAAIVRASHNERLQILDAVDLKERFEKTIPLLIRQVKALQLLQKTQVEDPEACDAKKSYIKRKLHEEFDKPDEVLLLEKKVGKTVMPDYAKKTAMREIHRLKKMSSHMPDHAVTRNYVELLLDLPWCKVSPEVIDIKKSRHQLDTDHYGMEKLKKRVLEYLAVRQLKNSLKGPILCFVGPPGVGKTSVGKSIARSLGREFHRISVGGVCDQADIRGHRRTYIGAMPGRIIQGLKAVGVKNPVFLLDEIDKMSPGVHGDPSAAMLEVLDPEQNCSFTDHYVNVPFDLSQVMFIATANHVKKIPPALRDRMEIISVPGYSQEEKLHIARDHLIPKQLEEHGLTSEMIEISSGAIATIVSRYTRESGVRDLERKIAAICRAVAVKVVERQAEEVLSAKPSKRRSEDMSQHSTNNSSVTLVDASNDSANFSGFPFMLDEEAVCQILGPALYDNEVKTLICQPGIAIGLAWTEVGGQIMFVEATKVDGNGELTLTGQLGRVMKESAKIALNWVRSHTEEYGITVHKGFDLMEGIDIHIHFPAGAVEKDGPSAGITILTVLISLFTKRLVRSDVAMTGEITLRGIILPVGGVKEKILAAHRAGINECLLPAHNKKDLREIPKSVLDSMTFHFCANIDDALQVAFEHGFPPMLKVDTHLSSKL